ncbi:hypothetical protein NQ315_003224 [Exocentrus adspersus]|uniref:RNase H type-1 domain-containing protein n=1 Tax=Exocentrus adspersus TaxID=1586481 RepID=A0AAV8VNQ7_9CUCU|nr:hypothetical protein NQ315_003224 [Exocentrus adspersus]
MWQLRRVVGKYWGLKPGVLHWVYTAVVRPRLQYGALVWWPCVDRVTVANRLTRAQGLPCLGIMGAMRTTPTAALEVLLGLPPLSTWIVREAMAAFLRIRDAGGWRARRRYEGHAAIALRAEREVPISAMRVNEAKDSLRLRKSYSTTFPSREQWKQEGNMFPPGSLVCYTDGSRTRNEYSGAGIYLESSGAQQSYSLGSYASVFQAEVFAILMVAQREDVKNCTEERIFICSDSQAALRAISSPRTRSMLVQECGDALESLARQKEMGLVWVFGHTGIPGNERADQLARTPQGPEPILGISRGSINGALSRWAYRRLEISWRMNTGCRQAHNFLYGPDRSKTAWLLNLGRKALNQMVGILTGHCRLRRHLHLMGIEESPLCPECGEGEDTPIHLLGHCIAFGRLRYKVFGAAEMQGGRDERPTVGQNTDVHKSVRQARGRQQKECRRTKLDGPEEWDTDTLAREQRADPDVGDIAQWKIEGKERDQHGKKSPTDHQHLKDTGHCGIPLPSKITC